MDITSLTSASNSLNFLDPATATRATGKQTLDVNDFLKLITVQLTSQDPMKPMEDTQFISQMANFTSLEQMRTLSQNFASFAADQKLSAAHGYLGRIATVATDVGDITGEVTEVNLTDGAPRLVIGGGEFDPADVIRIATRTEAGTPATASKP